MSAGAVRGAVWDALHGHPRGRSTRRCSSGPSRRAGWLAWRRRRISGQEKAAASVGPGALPARTSLEGGGSPERQRSHPQGDREPAACRSGGPKFVRSERESAAGGRACFSGVTRAPRRVATLGVAWQSIVWDRLPRRRVRHELADARSDPRIAVECTHPNADRIGVVWVAAEERRTAVTAEPFLATAVRFPHTKPVVASDHPKRAGRRVGIRRGCHAAATLAALAVAIARADERSRHLESDGPAVAAADEWEIGHLQRHAPSVHPTGVEVVHRVVAASSG